MKKSHIKWIFAVIGYLFLVSSGFPIIIINLLCGTVGIFFITLFVMLGMQEFGQTHDKVRELLADIYTIAPALRRNWWLVTSIVFVVSSFVGALALIGMYQFTDERFSIVVRTQIYVAITLTMIFFVSTNLYFVERGRITQPLKLYLVGWFLFGATIVSELLISDGGAIPLTVWLVHFLFTGWRHNRKYYSYIHGGKYAEGLKYVHNNNHLATYFDPTYKLYNLALFNFHLGNLDIVKQVADNTLQAKSAINLRLFGYQQILNIVGLSALQVGAHATARQYLEAALRLENPPANIYDTMGEVYLRQGEYPDFAIKFFDTALGEATAGKNKQFKQFIPLYLAGRAWGLALLGRSSEVDSTIDTIEENELSKNAPVFAEYHIRLGQARLIQGKVDLAMKHFQEASNADKDGFIGNQAREMLAQIGPDVSNSPTA